MNRLFGGHASGIYARDWWEFWLITDVVALVVTYGHAARLAERGYWVVCVDEIANYQILERHPIRRAIPGSIEQCEFEYTRHGTAHLLIFLVVHTGLMEAVFLECNDHEHYLPELKLFHRQHKHLKGVYPIQDIGSSHIAADTRRYFFPEPRLVEATLYPSQRVVAEPGGYPHPRLQTLLPESWIMEKQNRIQNTCPRLLARLQSPIRASL